MVPRTRIQLPTIKPPKAEANELTNNSEPQGTINNNKPIVIGAADFYIVEGPTNTAEGKRRIGFDLVFRKLLWNPH